MRVCRAQGKNLYEHSKFFMSRPLLSGLIAVQEADTQVIFAPTSKGAKSLEISHFAQKMPLNEIRILVVQIVFAGRSPKLRLAPPHRMTRRLVRSCKFQVESTFTSLPASSDSRFQGALRARNVGPVIRCDGHRRLTSLRVRSATKCIQPSTLDSICSRWNRLIDQRSRSTLHQDLRFENEGSWRFVHTPLVVGKLHMEACRESVSLILCRELSGLPEQNVNVLHPKIRIGSILIGPGAMPDYTHMRPYSQRTTLRHYETRSSHPLPRCSSMCLQACAVVDKIGSRAW